MHPFLAAKEGVWKKAFRLQQSSRGFFKKEKRGRVPVRNSLGVWEGGKAGNLMGHREIIFKPYFLVNTHAGGQPPPPDLFLHTKYNK